MSSATNEATVRFYNDGLDWPATPELLAAERAYRAAFLAGAHEAAEWPFPDIEAIEDARQARRCAREAAEVLIDEQIVYRAGHEVEAARTRGRHQALEIAAQVWERTTDRGLSDERIAAEVIGPWLANVAHWAAQEIDPARIAGPPRPDDDWPDEPQENTVMPEPNPNGRRSGNLAWLYQQDRTPPERPTLPARSVRDLVFDFPHLREPVIHGLLRQGETMNVIASSKTGKSWLVTDLALSVATGRPWLDTFPTERGNVLIIDNELHRETSAHRIPKVMEARGIRLDEVGQSVFVANVRGRLKDIIGLGTHFAEMQPGQYRLIILDAFYRFMPKDMDENDNGTMATVYNYLDSYAARIGCSFVLVHHSTKGNQSGKAVTDVGAGAGAQSRATDTHLVLRPHEQPDVVVLDAAVRSWPPVMPRCLRWTFPVWTLDDTLDPADLRPERPRRKPKPEVVEARPVEPAWDAERFAVAFVGQEPIKMLAIVQAAMDAGLSERKANRLLKQAESDGLVHRWRFGANHPVLYATKPQPEGRE
ncbi:MAG: helicase RepA family protein [Bryobacteraceae bacterium]|nr:helicase RepA family protein [Bryobacteraceae bacterium]